jgi:CheY-like chemotaxis protein
MTTTKSVKILWTDDDLMLRRCGARMLSELGYDVTTAEDGLQAWELLQTTDFDLLITDHDMPRLKGIELANRLRQAGRTLPIIVTSGTPGFETNFDWPWLRLNALIPKPFTPDELIEAVSRVLDIPSALAGESCVRAIQA